MIIYNPKNWFSVILTFRKSDTLRVLFVPILTMGLFTTLIAYLEITYFSDVAYLKNLITVYSLIGFVISMLLVFRTNTAYDRWWEGRKKWGELLNNSRNLSLKLVSLVQDKEDLEFFKRFIPNYAQALRLHLKQGVSDWSKMNFTEAEQSHLQKHSHIPSELVRMMYQRLVDIKRSGRLSEMEYQSLDQHLNSFLDICGACERIRKTPIPFSYSMFLKKFILMYVLTIPLALVPILGYLSSVIATFIFYILVSIELIAEEIEDPFGDDDNDLPTDVIAENIYNNVKEIIE